MGYNFECCVVFRDPNRYSNGSWVPSLGGTYWPVHSVSTREYLEIGSIRHKNKTGLNTKERARLSILLYRNLLY